MKSSIFLFILWVQASLYAASFSTGSAPKALTYTGEIEVHCNPQGPREPTFARYYCRQNTLEPHGERSHFYHKTELAIDAVELINRGPQGEILARFQSGFDSAKGRSDREVNLWILTNVDRPFLKFGLNTIDYRLKYKNQVKEQGRILVDTRWGGEKKCLNQIFLNRPVQDCKTPVILCDRYFWTSKDCK